MGENLGKVEERKVVTERNDENIEQDEEERQRRKELVPWRNRRFNDDANQAKVTTDRELTPVFQRQTRQEARKEYRLGRPFCVLV